MYYRDTAVVLLTYDVTREESFEQAHELLQDFREKADDDALIYLVGNKADLQEER